ncbi:MAG: hypothetical protein KKC23_09175 [Proteobacteria bacterium]|nr:hypothetical protein [Pseudomonadota bacterium]
MSLLQESDSRKASHFFSNLSLSRFFVAGNNCLKSILHRSFTGSICRYESMTPDILAAFIHLFVGQFTYLWMSRKFPLTEGTVFIPFHFGEMAVNLLTNDALDPVARIPEFKVCAVSVTRHSTR